MFLTGFHLFTFAGVADRDKVVSDRLSRQAILDEKIKKFLAVRLQTSSELVDVVSLHGRVHAACALFFLHPRVFLIASLGGTRRRGNREETDAAKNGLNPGGRFSLRSPRSGAPRPPVNSRMLVAIFEHYPV